MVFWNNGKYNIPDESGMTLKEAIADGYKLADCTTQSGYLSRKTDIENSPVYIAGGTRKGQLYILRPNFSSTRYYYRQYLVKEGR